MKKIILIVSILLIAWIFSVQTGLSEEENMYAYGTIVQKTGDSILVEEVVYDEEGNEVKETNEYFVTENVELDNAESIDDIKIGAEVDVDYVSQDGKNIAEYVYVYSD